MAHAYVSANDVVQLADVDHDRIVVKGNVSISYLMNPYFVNHTLTLELKDGRYRYTITDFQLSQTSGSWTIVPGQMGHGGYAKRVAPKIDKLIAGLKEAMQETGSAGEDDW